MRKTKIARILALTAATLSLIAVSAQAKDYNTSAESGTANRLLDGTEGEGSATILKGGVDRITATDQYVCPNTVHVTYNYNGKSETDDQVVRTSKGLINPTYTYTPYSVKTKATYYVYWKVTKTNADTLRQNRYVTLEPNNATLTKAPMGKTVEYTGDPQALVDAGTATNGKVQYSLNNSTWSTTVPTASDEGTYTVYYKVVGNTNYNGTAPATVTAKIEKYPAMAMCAPAGEGEYYGEGDDIASLWEVALVPGTDAVTSIDVKVNDRSSNEGAWECPAITEGTVLFTVAVNLAQADVESVTAVANGEDVETYFFN